MAKTQTVASTKAATNKKAAVAAKAKPITQQAQHDHPVISEEQRSHERRANAAMKQFVAQQMATPIVQAPALTTPPQTNEGFLAEMAALQAKYNIAPETLAANVQLPKVVREPKDAKNGITRPGMNTKCGMIWGMCDAITAQTHLPATMAQLKMQPSMGNINDHTLKTQYARWRAYNNITGRLAVPVVVSEPVAPVYNAPADAEESPL